MTSGALALEFSGVAFGLDAQLELLVEAFFVAAEALKLGGVRKVRPRSNHFHEQALVLLNLLAPFLLCLSRALLLQREGNRFFLVSGRRRLTELLPLAELYGLFATDSVDHKIDQDALQHGQLLL